MERNLKEITTLAADFQYHCDNWGQNPHATSVQRRLWPGEKLAHSALGKDAPNCLRLLREDGHDGEPVFSLDQAYAQRMFSSDQHFFPSDRDVMRFGMFCRLGFFRTLHLVVKNQWEKFVIEEKRRSPDGCSGYSECLTNFEDRTLAQLLDRFRPGPDGRVAADEIYLLFEKHGGLPTQSGYDRQRFSALIDQMILSRVHYRSTASCELESFLAFQEREIALLKAAGQGDEQEFWLKKSCWLAVQRELEDSLLLREDIRLRNFNVTMEWMALFGAHYIELLEARLLCQQMEQRVAMKRADPSLSIAEIDKRIIESFKSEMASFDELKRDARHAALPAFFGTIGEQPPEEEVERLRDEVKKIIREIWRLTHPDTLDRAFTASQRQKLRDYLEQAVKIRREETQLDMRDVSILKDILSKVKETYVVMGIDLEPQSVIRGDTLAEQIAWLEIEIGKFERQIRELRAEIHAMSMEPDIREKIASMAGDTPRRQTMLALEQRKKEFELRITGLQEEYKRLIDQDLTPT
jgi:hypothetical protein